MKFLKNTFEFNINNYNKIHDNNELENINSINEFNNIIIYGREGIGKYTEALYFIKKFSPSELKYEKKLAINSQNNKHDLYIKISDIHYEIDFQLLGYNSKILFNDFYNLVCEIICTKKNKQGIILCKNFEYIDNEILELFYSYLKNDIKKMCTIKFIILTTGYSFLSDNIINLSKIIALKVPKKYNIKKINNTNKSNTNKSNIININKCNIINTNINIPNDENINFNINEIYIKNYKDALYLKNVKYNKSSLYNIYNKIINNDVEFDILRNDLYDLLIYRIDINTFIWELIELLIINNNIDCNQCNHLLIKTFNFIIQYNNNYRPIFHLENYILYLIKIVNGY